VLEPIVKRIEVPCSQKKAFTVFLDEMDTWWPLDRFTTSKMAGSSVKEIRVDAKAGGEIIEVSVEGTEYPWGKINTYDPFGFFSMDFHITHPDHETGPMSLVEVSFTAVDSQRTLVELKQSNWEVFGDMAKDIYGGYNFGWGLIFEQNFKDACSK